MLDVATLAATAVADSMVGRLSEAAANSTAVAVRSTGAGSTADAAEPGEISLVSSTGPAAMTAGLFSFVFFRCPVLYPPQGFLLECRSLNRRGSKMNVELPGD